MQINNNINNNNSNNNNNNNNNNNYNNNNNKDNNNNNNHNNDDNDNHSKVSGPGGEAAGNDVEFRLPGTACWIPSVRFLVTAGDSRALVEGFGCLGGRLGPTCKVWGPHGLRP